jgi:hypothetical protein
MACVDGGHESPGYLRLDYLHSSRSIPHSTRARLVFGVDPLDGSLMFSTANAWSEVWAGLVTNQFSCDTYSVLRHDGSLLYSAALDTPQVGVHAAASGALDYASRTLCFTGRGTPDTVGLCSGEAIGRVFVGAAFEFTAGQKFTLYGVDALVDDYIDFLRGDPTVWADEFGFKAGVRGRVPVQFNAYAQGRNGT